MRIADVISEAEDGSIVELRGWIYRIRSSGKVVFCVIRDGSGIIQVTAKKGVVDDSSFDDLIQARVESSMMIRGKVFSDERAPSGKEIRAEWLRTVHLADPFPIGEFQSEELLLDNRHLWIRSREQNAVAKIKATVLGRARQWLDEHDFIEVTPPMLTGIAPEDTTALFPVKYFDRVAYLSQSAQFYLEAMCFSYEKVYALAPSFRAEKSRTLRHLSEFWHLEAEMAWMGHADSLRIQEELVTAIVGDVLKFNESELKLLNRDIEKLKLVEPPFERMSYAEALDLLKRRGRHLSWGDAFGTNEERALTEDIGRPLFIVNFPIESKPFYMRPSEELPGTYSCADLLAPEGFGEIIGGSEREPDYESLLMRIEQSELNPEDYAWYLDLRRFGSVPHSGFGLGVERVVRWICCLEHIRDAMPFPRTPSRVTP